MKGCVKAKAKRRNKQMETRMEAFLRWAANANIYLLLSF